MHVYCQTPCESQITESAKMLITEQMGKGINTKLKISQNQDQRHHFMAK
jgi:hypothetical protein